MHDDAETRAWFCPRLAERLMSKYGPERVEEFAKMLDSPRRVFVSIAPGTRVGYDGDKMGAATAKAREAGAIFNRINRLLRKRARRFRGGLRDCPWPSRRGEPAAS